MDGNTARLIFDYASKNYYGNRIELGEKDYWPRKAKYYNSNRKKINSLINAGIIKGKVSRNTRAGFRIPYSFKLKKTGSEFLAEKYYKLFRMKYSCLYNIINSIDLPIISVSYPSFNIIGINKKAQREIKLFRKCVVFVKEIRKGNNILRVLSKVYSSENWSYIAKMLYSKSPVYLPNIELENNGKKIYYKLMYQPILNPYNKITGFMLIPIDITREVEQKEYVENLARFKDEFLYSITHEFKTPLVVISSALQAMETLCKDELTDRIKRYLNRIKQNTFRQIRLVNNLLDIARIEAGHIKLFKRNQDIVAITRLITESVSMFADLKGVELLFSSDINKKVIAIDEEKYERIMLNLLSNAIKFTPKGKSVYVEVSTREGYVEIKVKDSGIGIPKDKINTIFERFGQVDSSLSRNAEGTGIGLSLVHMFVDAMGGKITVKSKENVGSTFTVFLPDVITECISENDCLGDLCDNRLIQAIKIEFSDIYFDENDREKKKTIET
ncbi:sensor histidine kinase [Acetivibrio straminisolvens]|nr:HAMP domain-containing sensor histidine kinase [Acetivibrio straminisolvens]